MRGDDRSAGDDQGAVEGAIGDVGDVDHHAEAVHLVDNVFSEFGEAFLGVGNGGVFYVAGAVGPVVGVGPGEGHVANAECIVLAQEANRVLDGVATFDSHEGGELMVAVGFFNALGRGNELDLIRVAGDLLLD